MTKKRLNELIETALTGEYVRDDELTDEQQNMLLQIAENVHEHGGTDLFVEKLRASI